MAEIKSVSKWQLHIIFYSGGNKKEVQGARFGLHES
jgi:hypothetical protein